MESIAQQVSKPYKVCPDVVTAKDTPCRVATPAASIVVRDIVTAPSALEQENKVLKDMIERLVEKLEELEKQNATK